MMYDRPIPGQSLTTQPKNAPYENPPQISDPQKALMHHLEILGAPDATDDILFFISDLGVDVKTLAEGALRQAVMGGVHSVDVSLIIGPVIHEFIRGIPLAAGIDFDEGFEGKKAREETMYERNKFRSQKMLEELGIAEAPKVAEEEEKEEAPVEQEEEPTEQPNGLMARKQA